MSYPFVLVSSRILHSINPYFQTDSMLSMSSVDTKPWFAPHMQCYSTQATPNAGNGTLSHHQTFNSVAINPDTYLASLQRRAVQLGARCLTADLATASGFVGVLQAFKTLVSEAADDTGSSADTLVINCSGFAAKGLCGDETVFPIRGQTLLVRITPPVAQKILLYDAGDSVTYIVPRPGTDAFIFGGTKDAGNSDPVPTPDISASIIERCKRLLANKGYTDLDVQVVQEQVGFRPGRKGGARVEVENVKLGNGEVVRVVHNYGHAGTGYQGSIGSARKVLRLVEELVR